MDLGDVGRQLAQAYLDGDFPQAHRTYEHVVRRIGD
jgi:hypothetical protein